MQQTQAPQVHDMASATAAASKWLSPRYHRLDKLERYVRGTQYEGRDDFMSPRADTPLLERAPNIVHSLVESALRQHIDFAIGGDRFPKITTQPSEDEQTLGEALPESTWKVLDAFIRVLCSDARLRDRAADAMADAEGCGTSVTVVALARGVPELQTLRAKWCTPRMSGDGKTVESVEIVYPYVEHYQDGQRQWRARARLFRRVIDAQSDKVFKPLVIAADGGLGGTTWTVDASRSVEHGLGFCPVVWYAHKAQSARVDEVDGCAVHETQLDELDAMNFALSQRGRAALYAGDPQMYEAGVPDREEPAQTGRAAIVERHGYSMFGIVGGGRPARRKGAGTVWRYANPDAKVAMLTLPGDALDSITQHAVDLEDKIGAVLGYTRSSPETVKGATSGKALGYLFSRTTGFVDGLRSDFWDGWLAPVVSMLLRVVSVVEARAPGSVYVPGATRVAALLRTSTTGPGEEGEWRAPRMRAQWGRYFDLTPQDEQSLVGAVTDALSAKAIPLRLALEKLRDVFPHESSEQLALEMQERHDADAQRLMQQMQAAAHDDEDDDEGDEPKAPPPQPKPPR